MDAKQKKMLIIAGAIVAVVIVVAVVAHLRKKKRDAESRTVTFEEVSFTPKLASFEELISLGYSDSEAKQIMNSESYKQGIKNY